MLCEICQKNEATIHQQSIINGVEHSQHICHECAEKAGMHFWNGLEHFLGENHVYGNTISQWFQPYFQEKNSSTIHKQKQTADKVCPTCGITWKEFQKNGLLGCADCYKYFEDELPTLLRRIHGHTEHIGKKPLQSMSEAEKQLDEVDQLKKAMATAIKDENFEEAARLRDAIKNLEHNRIQEGGENAATQ